jgi:hypothetical protein
MWSWLGFKENNNNNNIGTKNQHSNNLGDKTNHEKIEILEHDDILENLTIDEKLSSLISQNAYLNNEERRNIGDYLYKPEDSFDNIATYYNPKLNKVIIGHRGTSISKAPMRDLYSDLIIGLGVDKSFDPRFNENKIRVMDIMDKYGDVEYQHTGHSLGGSHSKAYGKHFGHKSINFNTGSGLDYIFGKESQLTEICNKPNPPKWCDETIDIGIEGDILSKYSGYGRKKKFIAPHLSLFNKHTIRNYIPQVFFG